MMAYEVLINGDRLCLAGIGIRSGSEKEHVRWWVKKLGWTVIEGPVPDQRKK